MQIDQNTNSHRSHGSIQLIQESVQRESEINIGLIEKLRSVINNEEMV